MKIPTTHMVVPISTYDYLVRKADRLEFDANEERSKRSRLEGEVGKLARRLDLAREVAETWRQVAAEGYTDRSETKVSIIESIVEELVDALSWEPPRIVSSTSPIITNLSVPYLYEYAEDE